MSEVQIDANNLISMMRSKDKVIKGLMDKIQEVTDGFTESNSENLKKLLSTEYLIFKVRTQVVAELTEIKAIITNPAPLTKSLIPIFKQREVQLLTLNTRLTELREDFAAIQKTAYYNHVIKSNI